MKKIIEKLMALRGVLFFAFVLAGMVFAAKVSQDEKVKQQQIVICELIEEGRE